MVRDKSIDIAKGLGIFLVVWGHMSPPSGISMTIWLFHMPLFFLLSGMTLNLKYDFLDFAKNKVKSLLLPFVFFEFFFRSYHF